MQRRTVRRSSSPASLLTETCSQPRSAAACAFLPSLMADSASEASIPTVREGSQHSPTKTEKSEVTHSPRLLCPWAAGQTCSCRTSPHWASPTSPCTFVTPSENPSLHLSIQPSATSSLQAMRNHTWWCQLLVQQIGHPPRWSLSGGPGHLAAASLRQCSLWVSGTLLHMTAPYQQTSSHQGRSLWAPYPAWNTLASATASGWQNKKGP